MDILEGIILGAVQGLTEFLPISSSGHLGLGRELLGIEGIDNMAFDLALHGATVLSTIVVFRKDIWRLITSLFKFEMNNDTKTVLKLLLSAVPVLFVGLFLKDYVENVLGGNILLIGIMLLVTATLLWLTTVIKPPQREIGFKDAFVIGIAQAIAVLPGLSRSGATISTGLLLGVKKSEVAAFSFLMVLIPIIGGNILEIADLMKQPASAATTEPIIGAIIGGTITAFIVGWLACKFMINLVKKGSLKIFAIYCLVVGIATIIYSLS